MKEESKQLIYLNDADGRKPKLLSSLEIQKPPELLFKQLKERMERYWEVDVDTIEFAQNTTTHIAYLIEIIKKGYPNAVVLLDLNEIRWIKKTIERGKLPLHEMTYGNYVGKSHQYLFPKSEPQLFSPSDRSNLLSLRKRYQHAPAIVILCHVSRQTGEQFPVESLIQETRSLNPETFFIIDGAQSLGAIPSGIKQSCRAYLTVSSKFIGAEPHVGMAYLSSRFRKQFLFQYTQINPQIYHKELYSAVSQLSEDYWKGDFMTHIRSLKKFAIEKLNTIHGIRVVSPENQVPHILTISVGSETKTRRITRELKERFNIIVYNNISYNIIKPTIPLLRISISPRTKKEGIQALIFGLNTILS